MTDKEQIIIDGVDVSECKYVCNTVFGKIGCKQPLMEKIYCSENLNCYFKQLQKEKFENLNNRQMVESAENLIYENSELYRNIKEKEQECEKLKKQLMQKSEVDMFFNTPIEGWSNDPCGICPHKAENEELKKKFSKFFNIDNQECWDIAFLKDENARYKQALDEIEKELKEDIYCENQECGCDDFEECLKCTKEHILDIINKAKEQ